MAHDTPDALRASDHLVDLLIAQGIKRLHGVPGESFLPVLDALHGREGDIDFITYRQEGGAAMAADADARLSGRPGVCFVTRGPGASNASAGIHIAYQDSTPLIVFIGQVARGMMEREAFQEIDYRHFFAPMAKWVAQVDDASRLQEFVTRAVTTALSGRPGPVVLALPEDMLSERVTPSAPAKRIEAPRYRPTDDAMQVLQRTLANAQRPLIIAGGGGWTPHGRAALAEFAERHNLPVAVSLRKQDLMDNSSAHFVGHYGVVAAPYLQQAIATCDVLLAIGPRLGEMTTAGYTLLQTPVPEQTLVHVFPCAEEINRVFQSSLSLVADTESFCQAAAALAPPTTQDSERTQWKDTLRADFLTYSSAASVPGDPLAPLFAHINDVLPADAIICNGAGNYAGWVHRFIHYRDTRAQLAPTSGSMGYGLPAAIGAALAEPQREVIAIAGDGCFMMTSQELATACQHRLKLAILVIDNAGYGTIRAHQQREFPDRPSGTALSNPDFVAFARAFGAMGAKTTTLAEFKDALAAARQHPGVSLIEIPLDPRVLAPGRLPT